MLFHPVLNDFHPTSIAQVGARFVDDQVPDGSWNILLPPYPSDRHYTFIRVRPDHDLILRSVESEVLVYCDEFVSRLVADKPNTWIEILGITDRWFVRSSRPLIAHLI